MPKTLRIARRILITGLAIYWSAIAMGTHLPGHAMEAVKFNDKLLHSGAYLGLSILLCWSVMQRRPTARRMAAVLTIALLYGVVDELTQTLVPNRTADLYDWLADFCGAIMGLAFYYVSLRTLNGVMAGHAADWASTLPMPIAPPSSAKISVQESSHHPDREWRKDAA